jgi:uncharacterized membrane protein
MFHETAASRLDGKIAVALSYPFWLIAIILFASRRDDPFVRFHALQSILLHVSFTVAAIAVWLAGIIIALLAQLVSNSGALELFLETVMGLIFWLLVLAYIGTIIFAAIKAYQDSGFVLPLIGRVAERWCEN